MDNKRKQVVGKKRPDYPDMKEARQERRSFLWKIGGGVIGLSLLGLGSCDSPFGSSTTTSGVSPADIGDVPYSEVTPADGSGSDGAGSVDGTNEHDYILSGVDVQVEDVPTDVAGTTDASSDEVGEKRQP